MPSKPVSKPQHTHTMKLLKVLSKQWLERADVQAIKLELEKNGHKNLKKLGFKKLKRFTGSFAKSFRAKANVNYGRRAIVWKRGRIIVKLGPEVCDEWPKQRCPTIITSKNGNSPCIKFYTEYFIQPVVNITAHKTECAKQYMSNLTTDGHEFNWGFWKGVPVFFDW